MITDFFKKQQGPKRKFANKQTTSKNKKESTNNEEEEDPCKIDNIHINQNSWTKQNQTKNTKGNTKGTKRKQLDWLLEENFPL